MLEAFLDFHRATLRWKCAGLTAEQLRARPVEPSTMSLLGLVRHLTDVEYGWFVHGFGGGERRQLYYSDDNPDGDFDDVDEADVEETFRVYEETIAQVKSVVAQAGLEERFTSERSGTTFQLRWVYLHMLEEYARHNGHADLFRERLDGAKGE